MKFQRSTWILLLVALGFGGLVYGMEQRQPVQPETAIPTAQPIFSLAADQVKTLRLQTRQQTLLFKQSAPERSAARATPGGSVPQLPELSSTWRLQQPLQAPASEASVAYLLNLMATGMADRVLTIAASQKAQFGFDQPLAIVEVTLEDQTRHQLVIGDFTFDESYLYALADPSSQPSGALKVLLIPTVFENAVNRPLGEWQDQDKASKPSAAN